MSDNKLPYANHIYDQGRIEIARSIIEKESRKLLLGLADDTWQVIDSSIQGWSEKPADYHLENNGPQDFWDSFAAILESIKLKSNFTAWVTAENVQWHKTSLPVRQISMTSPLEQLEKVPGLHVRSDLPFAELIDTLAQHPDCVAEQKKLIAVHSTDPTQDAYPIIVQESNKELCKVMDGNRRTLQAALYGKSEIEAWVGKINGDKPVNFWIPLNDMFQLVKIFKEAIDCGDEQLQQAIVSVLKSRFKISTVAKQAYLDRIGNQTQTAKVLFDLTQQDSSM